MGHLVVSPSEYGRAVAGAATGPRGLVEMGPLAGITDLVARDRNEILFRYESFTEAANSRNALAKS